MVSQLGACHEFFLLALTLSLSFSFILSLSLSWSAREQVLKALAVTGRCLSCHLWLYLVTDLSVSASVSIFLSLQSFCFCFSQLSISSLTSCQMLSISCLYLDVKSLAIFLCHGLIATWATEGRLKNFFAALAWCRFIVRCCMLGLCDVAVVAKSAVHCNAEVCDGSCLFAYPLLAAKSLTFSKLDYSSLAWC